MNWLPDAMRFVPVDETASSMIESDGEQTEEVDAAVEADPGLEPGDHDDDGTEALAAAA